MPGAIRHPENAKITGFRLSDRDRHRLGHKGALKEVQIFSENIESPLDCNILISKNLLHFQFQS
jgi:hypothetical protein